jgi:hypothetical protein
MVTITERREAHVVLFIRRCVDEMVFVTVGDNA